MIALNDGHFHRLFLHHLEGNSVVVRYYRESTVPVVVLSIIDVEFEYKIATTHLYFRSWLIHHHYSTCPGWDITLVSPFVLHIATVADAQRVIFAERNISRVVDAVAADVDGT